MIVRGKHCWCLIVIMGAVDHLGLNLFVSHQSYQSVAAIHRVTGFSYKNGFTSFCLKISGTSSSLHISGPVLLFLNGNVICPALRAQWIELFKEGLIWILIQSRLLAYLVELWSWVNHKLCTLAGYYNPLLIWNHCTLDRDPMELKILIIKFMAW